MKILLAIEVIKSIDGPADLGTLAHVGPRVLKGVTMRQHFPPPRRNATQSKPRADV